MYNETIAVCQFAEVENFMTSVERIVEYIQLPIEGQLGKKIILPQSKWPKQGVIEIHNMSASYRSHLPNVLNSINIKINHKDKIGIVGRTGSGKSSLFLTIFRLQKFI